MALFFAVVLGIAGLCVCSVNHQVKEEMKLPPPRLDRTMAEGLRLWNPKTGVDSVRFDSCSIEKMRMGFFALGGFNVLCIRGLVLNLPLDAEDSEGMRDEGRGKSEGQGAGKEALAGLLPKSLMERMGLYAKRFSGIRVDGLSVNRVANRSVVPVFAAERMKNRGKTLELNNCRVFGDDGSTNLVDRAELRLKPVPVLAWNGGERRLDDLLK
ncbi:MAG: hypothetical protein KBT68_05950 [bacterium]|nr:hypothetical protein [Candidatus Colisoma equi]